MADRILTQSRLKELLHYDPDTGVFTRAKAVRGHKKGAVAGCDNGRGYIRIKVDGRYFLAHRLAWLYETASFPEGEIDHINRNGLDNRIKNLRTVTRSENLLNKGLDHRNTSGVKNVSWDQHREKWVAQVRRNKKQFNLGRFATKDEAVAAVKNFNTTGA